MSNFLLRVVTRAAGLGPANGPRPRTETPRLLLRDPVAAPPRPPQFAPTDLPAGIASRQAELPGVTEDLQAPSYAADHGQPIPDQPIPPPSPVVRAFNRSINRVAPLPGSEWFEVPKTEASAEIAGQPVVAVNHQIAAIFPEEPEDPRHREAAPEISKRPVLVVSQEIHNTFHEDTSRPAQVVGKSVRSAEPAPAKPATILLENDEVPRSRDDKQSNQPSLVEPPAPPPQRTRRSPPTPAVVGQQEAPIEVKIGRVEVHMEAQAAPAPVAARPQGFAEYTALRSYRARPWDFRNR